MDAKPWMKQGKKILVWNINQRSGKGGGKHIPSVVLESIQGHDIVILNEFYKVKEWESDFAPLFESHEIFVTDNEKNEILIAVKKDIAVLESYTSPSNYTLNLPDYLEVKCRINGQKVAIVGARILVDKYDYPQGVDEEMKNRRLQAMTLINRLKTLKEEGYAIVGGGDFNTGRRANENEFWSIGVLKNLLPPAIELLTPKGYSHELHKGEFAGTPDHILCDKALYMDLADYDWSFTENYKEIYDEYRDEEGNWVDSIPNPYPDHAMMKGVFMNKRIEKICSIMAEQKRSQMLITDTAAVYYLTGLWIEPHERMLGVHLTIEGELCLYGNTMFGIDPDCGVKLVLHKDGEDAVADLAKALHEGELIVDKFCYAKFLIPLLEKRPDVTPILGENPIDLARRYKDEEEKAKMRHSSLMNDEVMGKVQAAIKAGVRENELASLVNGEYLLRGADCEGVQLVCFGANGADPHHGADSTVLKEGDSIICDIFTPINHYWCDMTRTCFYGSVSEKQREVYELVKKANLAAIAEVKPGVKLSHLDKTARDIITEGGYGEYFTHRLGHGCGIECHEPPDVSGACHEILAPGMIFSIEPGIYLPNEFGVRIEDLVLVTEDGCEVLNKYPKDLLVIPSK